jgi:hypothetical protein
MALPQRSYEAVGVRPAPATAIIAGGDRRNRWRAAFINGTVAADATTSIAVYPTALASRYRYCTAAENERNMTLKRNEIASPSFSLCTASGIGPFGPLIRQFNIAREPHGLRSA